MSRASSVHKIPYEVRSELDRLFLQQRMEVESGVLFVAEHGYRISRSAMHRYRRALLEGREDLALLNVGGRPLALALAEIVSGDDAALAELLQELITLQVQQVGVLKRMQAYVRDRRRAAAARTAVQTGDRA